MSGSDFPEAVRAFIERHVSSAVQIEVLLLLHQEPDKSWTAAAIGAELRIDVEQAEAALAHLARNGLLAREDSAYRFASRGRKAELVDALATLYPSYRVKIIALIFSKPRRPIQDFSDAFRLRAEE